MDRFASKAPRGRAATAALLALGLLSSRAPAADVDVNAGVLSYDAVAANTANDLTVSLANGTYTLVDPGEPIGLSANAVAAGCTPLDVTSVACPAAGLVSFAITTSGGADRVTLTGVAHPADVRAGQGADTVVGGTADDGFFWSPGDGNDTFDGGPGNDTLAVDGSSAPEIFTITTDGTGFDVARDVGVVSLDADGIETLELRPGDGLDTVRTTGLLASTQVIAEGVDLNDDALVYDGAGGCPYFLPGNSGLQEIGREPLHFSGFAYPTFQNIECGTYLDLSNGVLQYAALGNTENLFQVSRDGDTYVVADMGVAVVSPTPSAGDAGCAKAAANVVRCPMASVVSFNVDTSAGIDSILLTGVVHPATLRGGQGNDTVVGGPGDDIILWSPGDGSDVIDAGAGTDTLSFDGSNANEIITITADGPGFDLFRNVASIQLEVENTEVLDLETFGGTDVVQTTPLLNAIQTITAGTDTTAKTLELDAAGLCPIRQGNGFQTSGRQPILFANFPTVNVSHQFCRPDPCIAAVATQGCTVNGVPDQSCEGTPGDDDIRGTGNGDVILAGEGNDRIRGGGGDDLVCGGDGDDVLVGSAGHDVLAGGPGADRVRGSRGQDTLLGGEGDDDLNGGSDDLDGGPGDDKVRGAGHADVLRGDAGLDRLDGGSGDDLCSDADQLGPFIRCDP